MSEKNSQREASTQKPLWVGFWRFSAFFRKCRKLCLFEKSFDASCVWSAFFLQLIASTSTSTSTSASASASAYSNYLFPPPPLLCKASPLFLNSAPSRKNVSKIELLKSFTEKKTKQSWFDSCFRRRLSPFFLSLCCLLLRCSVQLNVEYHLWAPAGQVYW